MVAIYTRQSVDKKDSISIETQIEYCKHEAINEEIKIYTDKGYSGKNTNRPAFFELMEDIKNGLIEKVIVYRIDRISRSIVDFSEFINTIEKYGCSFVSSTEKFDTASPMGRAMLYIIVVFAQLERETIAERVKDNYYERLKKGGIGGGSAPFGFNIKRENINGNMFSIYTPNENIETVKMIFDEYSKSYTTLADVQRMLNEKNILTTKGKPWDNAKLSSILKSPVYVKSDIFIYNYYREKGAVIISDIEEFDGKRGCILAGKRESNTRKYSDVSNHTLAVAYHNGVIPSDTFLICQNKLSKNVQIKNTFKGKYSWLTGLVKCGYCGYSMSIRFGKTKEGNTAYFTCSGKYLYKICDKKQTHKVKDVEEYVDKFIIDKIKSANHNEENKKTDTSYLKKVSEIELKINNLINSLEDSSEVSAKYIHQRINELDREKQEIIKQNTKIIEEKAIVLPTVEEYKVMNFEDRKNTAISIIKAVNLTNGDIDIVWK